MRSSASVSFIFISDTHVGSRYGICSPAPEKGESEPDYYQPTSTQQKLYDGFQACIEQISQPNKIKALFLGGDLVDGENPKRPGQDLWTIDPIVAMYDFNRLLSPIASKAEKVFGIRGSDYHVSPGRSVINYDELACQMIGANPYRTGISVALERKRLAEKVQQLRKQGKKIAEIKLKDITPDKKPKSRLEKDLERSKNIFIKEMESEQEGQPKIPYPVTDVRFKGIFNGTAIVLKHFVNFSPNYMYRGTGLIRNDLIQTLQKDRHFPEGYNSIVYAYGHAHYYHYSGNATHHNFVIPCQKANDTYLRANGITEPDYGIIETIVEPNDQVIVLPYVLRGIEYPTQAPYVIK